jgi:glucokinase
MKTYIAVDLGGTNVRVGLVNEKLEILKAVREKSVHRDTDALYEQIKRMIKEVASMYTGSEKIQYIGISAAGFCDKGMLTFSRNLEINEFDPAGRLNRDFPQYKAALANDANCTALIEALAGSGKGYSTVFFFTVSTGIGCGLVDHGRLVDLPFEGGHNYIGYNGRFYELEQLCSGTGIITLAKINDLELSSAAELFSLVAQDDRKAIVVYDNWLKLFGSYIANMQLLFNSDVMILSGGVMKSKAVFWEDLKSVANAFVAPFPVRKLNLADAAFEQDTGLMGGCAVAMAMDHKLQ